MSALKQENMDVYLETLTDGVRSNLSVIQSNPKMPYLLHISKNPNLGVLVPRICKRQADSEDRTIPRVSTSEHLHGCILGYYTYVSDILISAVKDSKANDYRGGYYIYAIPYRKALKPNKKLVFDSETTDEVWLVPYDKDNREYVPERIGVCVPYRYNCSLYQGGRFVEVCFVVKTTKDIYLSVNPLKYIFKDQAYRFSASGIAYSDKSNLNIPVPRVTELEEIKDRKYQDILNMTLVKNNWEW